VRNVTIFILFYDTFRIPAEETAIRAKQQWNSRKSLK
jgi:hypothetical protein